MIKEVVDGIKVYFDRALGSTLLYRFERPQYEEEVKKFKDSVSSSSASSSSSSSSSSATATDSKEFHPSELYGAEHLLRLIGTLNRCVAVSHPPLASAQLSYPPCSSTPPWMSHRSRFYKSSLQSSSSMLVGCLYCAWRGSSIGRQILAAKHQRVLHNGIR